VGVGSPVPLEPRPRAEADGAVALRQAKRYPTAFDQINELTELRSALPWLAAVPRNVCAQTLVELDKAFQRCFKRIAMSPHWKRRGRDVLGLCEPHPKVWRLDGSALRFPKLGNLRSVVHRPLEGKPKTCTIRRDGDQCLPQSSARSKCPPQPIGLNRVSLSTAASQPARRLQWPPRANPSTSSERSLGLPTHAHRLSSKERIPTQSKGSRPRGAHHRKVRRQREHLLHSFSYDYAKSHGTVVIEKLNVQA